MRSRQRNRRREGTLHAAQQTRPGEKAIEKLLTSTAKPIQSSESAHGSRHASPWRKNRLKSPGSRHSSPTCPPEQAAAGSSPSKSSPCDGGIFTPDEDDQEWEQIMLQLEPPPKSSETHETEGRDSRQQIKGICMKGTGDWEPVNAKLDLSSNYSILDTKAAGELELTLHPMPRRMVSEKHLSHHSYYRPQFWASNVGLRSSNVGLGPGSIQIPTSQIDILVAHVKSEREDAHLIIGRTLYRMLKAGKEKTGQGAGAISDFRPDVHVVQPELHGSEQEGQRFRAYNATCMLMESSLVSNPQSVLESLSASQDEFVLELGENDFVSFPGNLASIAGYSELPKHLLDGHGVKLE